MARRLLKDTCPLAASILEGEHDSDLQHVIAAAQARQKMVFRPGTKVRLVGTGNPRTEGQVGVVTKANPKTISVGVGDLTYEEWDAAHRHPEYAGGEWNVTPNFLEVIS